MNENPIGNGPNGFWKDLGGLAIFIGLIYFLFAGPWWARWIARTFVGAFVLVALSFIMGTSGINVWLAALISGVGATFLFLKGK